MAHDAAKVPAEFADLFYDGKPDSDGNPVGLTDEQYDALKARKQAAGEWPFDTQEEDNG